MNETTLLEYLAKKMLEEAQTYKDDIAAGRLPDYAEYKHACGVHRGFLKANEIIQELKERMEKDDE
jgi:predicted house-cleaning noncanonical NTP pyrophosphatase (MazG superfamily)